MILEIILNWAGNLLIGTLIGAVAGAAIVMALFFTLSKLGAWNHARCTGKWKLASLWLVGMFFLIIGILSGSIWGFSRAAEEKLLQARISETPALTASFAPVRAAATQWIGTTLIMAQNPEWMKRFNESKQLPEAASAAILAFETGGLQLDLLPLTTSIETLSRQGVESLFPLIESRWLATESELFNSPIYAQLRPHLSEMFIGMFGQKEKTATGSQPTWLIQSLNQAAQTDHNPKLSSAELGSALQDEGFHHLFTKPLASLLSVQRWFLCLLLLSLLTIPPLAFCLLRRIFPIQPGL